MVNWLEGLAISALVFANLIGIFLLILIILTGWNYYARSKLNRKLEARQVSTTPHKYVDPQATELRKIRALLWDLVRYQTSEPMTESRPRVSDRGED